MDPARGTKYCARFLFRARERDLGREVALKLLRSGLAEPFGTEAGENPLLQAWGEAGHLLLRLDNRPDPLNPRTSLVTAHSALRAVLNWRAPLVL